MPLKGSSPKERTAVRIAAVSDLHGMYDWLAEEISSANPDVLVIAGDMHPCRRDMDSHQWFTKEFFPFIERLGIPVVATPGNHDFFLNDLLSLPQEVREQNLPKNLHLLCDEEIEVNGLSFYGSPWVPWINGNWCWEASDATLGNRFSLIPDNIDVLITHSPPCIAHEYVDISTANPKRCWRHFGSKELTKAIRDKKPRVNVCGHIHSGQHGGVAIKDNKGDEICKCYNVSRVNERYCIDYPVTIIDLPSKG